MFKTLTFLALTLAAVLALLILGGERSLLDSLRASMTHVAWEAVEAVRRSCQESFETPLSYVLNEARVREAWRMAAEALSHRSFGVSAVANSAAVNQLTARRKAMDRLTADEVLTVIF